jgi:hypothetical protein
MPKKAINSNSNETVAATEEQENPFTEYNIVSYFTFWYVVSSRVFSHPKVTSRTL